ncbi:MutS-related protein [Dinghuibacter silviterrae]|uniref:MutS-like protein n=1 Tax=Dinghuibacter silviterrae TaxID=1539049 RepID=A0A4R8DRX1_9BACT|nr:DNA mismatch repair protein MutS [Dinghuibacter silviterrae]TDX00175.1 MutS-like protein [Dinghuibacter silviterrae]
MEIDATTYKDLSVFSTDGEDSVFQKINFTRTTGGRDELENLLRHPHHDLDNIQATQDTLRWILEREDAWPAVITNGTLMVIEKYYTYNFDTIPHSSSPVDALAYKLFHGPDYSMVRYSAGHFLDFFRGVDHLLGTFSGDAAPRLFRELLAEVRHRLDHEDIHKALAAGSVENMNRQDVLSFGHFLLYRYKHQMLDLLRLYHRLDAYYGMAKAVRVLGLHFPQVRRQDTPVVKARGLFHLLLASPVPYDFQLDQANNFLFLTGANMGGKSTFIRAIGISVYLAHLGMGVPAEAMELSLFDGLLSNIQVQDNILKGESYFFNEVQRIKNTVLKVSDGKKWLILIDELFKGTNIEDAMNCSTAVIKGLVKVDTSLFVLSTHLYEIGATLAVYPNIAFRFFETEVNGDQLHFSYRLKEGISNDRIGYLILKREKVTALLEALPGKPPSDG